MTTPETPAEQPDLPKPPPPPAHGEPNPADMSQPTTTVPTGGTNPAVDPTAVPPPPPGHPDEAQQEPLPEAPPAEEDPHAA